jgi:hypothetical protein
MHEKHTFHGSVSLKHQQQSVEYVIKIQNTQINAATTKKQHKNKIRKPQTNTFSKYYKGNIKKFDIKYTHIIQVPYKQ